VPFAAAGTLLPLPDGRAFVAVGFDGRMEVRAADDGQRLRELAAAGPAHQPWLLGPPVLTADGRAVITYELRQPQQYEIVTTDVATGTARREPTPRLMRTSHWPHTKGNPLDVLNQPVPSMHLFDLVVGRRRSLFVPTASAVATTADGRTLAETILVVRDGQPTWELRVREVATGQQVSNATGNEPGLDNLAFAPDGRTLAAISYKTWMLITVADGRVIQRQTVDSPIAALAFTPDGRRLLTAHDDASALVWDIP
jgi:WD40 repeat protein